MTSLQVCVHEEGTKGGWGLVDLYRAAAILPIVGANLFRARPRAHLPLTQRSIGSALLRQSTCQTFAVSEEYLRFTCTWASSMGGADKRMSTHMQALKHAIPSQLLKPRVSFNQ